MAKWNSRGLAKQLRNEGVITRAVDFNIKERFESAKDLMIDDFNEHPVTQEIEAGPEHTGGLMDYGNLFSFIGFEAGSDPIMAIRNALYKLTTIKKVSEKVEGKDVVYYYQITLPTKAQLSELSKTPGWFDSRDWLDGIEHGISGFQYYLYAPNKESVQRASRSGTAIQAGSKHGGLFPIGNYRNARGLTPMSYISMIRDRFVREVTARRGAS
jgi:hypothetical protein